MYKICLFTQKRSAVVAATVKPGEMFRPFLYIHTNHKNTFILDLKWKIDLNLSYDVKTVMAIAEE